MNFSSCKAGRLEFSQILTTACISFDKFWEKDRFRTTAAEPQTSFVGLATRVTSTKCVWVLVTDSLPIGR